MKYLWPELWNTVTPKQKAITLAARANNNFNSLSTTLSALRCREMSLVHSFRETTSAEKLHDAM